MKKKTWVATMMADISRSNLNYEYNKAFQKGKFKSIDEEFISQFDGMYYAEQYANNDLKYSKEESQ